MASLVETVGRAIPADYWRPVSDQPAMVHQDYGWPVSAPVLGCMRDGRRKVVRLHQMDVETPAPRWITDCSEGWDVTDRITYWTPLAPLPAGYSEGGDS